jgi:hypothetical protein
MKFRSFIIFFDPALESTARIIPENINITAGSKPYYLQDYEVQ